MTALQPAAWPRFRTPRLIPEKAVFRPALALRSMPVLYGAVMATTPKAIDTNYRGFRFRSRLEARWAVFFDSLRVKFEYEREGYKLPSGRYLPDFYLPDIDGGIWMEVKPNSVGAERACQLIEELCLTTGRPGMLVDGEPMRSIEVASGVAGHEGYAWWPRWPSAQLGRCLTDGPYVFCTCPVCGKVGLEFDGRGGRVCGDRCTPDDKAYSSGDVRIVLAATEARMARFEHGQFGAH